MGGSGKVANGVFIWLVEQLPFIKKRLGAIGVSFEEPLLFIQISGF